MLDFDNLLRFDLFQQLIEWLNVSMRDYRKGRHYLETNALLMEHETDKELERLIIAQVEETIEIKQQMQYLQALLRDARRRGKTPAAIQDAYVNTYGGFVLDMPAWLEQAEQERSLLVRLRRPDRTTKKHVLLLQETLTRAVQDKNVAPEIIAEFHNELGYTLLQGPHPQSQAEYTQMLEQVMGCYEAALQVYTFERYPFQYARTYVQLGLVYQHYAIAIGQKEFIERAIVCFKAALWVYDRETFLEQWAMLQTHLGCAYTQRGQGELRDNLEYAISCHEHALRVVPCETFPTVWATAQINLGDAYRQRIAGGRSENLKKAAKCYAEALSVFLPHTFPRERAAIHTRLGFLFHHARADEIDMSEAMNLRCSIVCYDSALEVYTPDSFPVEHAATLVSLGNVHRKRTDGNRRENLEQARNCYNKALRVFTEQAFPFEHQQTLHSLHETERLLRN